MVYIFLIFKKFMKLMEAPTLRLIRKQIFENKLSGFQGTVVVYIDI